MATKRICANHCPSCGSEDIDYRTFEWFDDRVEYPATCCDCEMNFTEVYKYSFSEYEG